MEIMEGLIVKQPFAELIIDGKKTWELRSKSAPKKKINKEILLLSSGFALGKIKIKKCFEATKKEIIKNPKKHQSNINGLTNENYFHVWEVNVTKKFSNPKKYSHPLGARIWVKNVDFKKQVTLSHFY